MSWDHLYAVDHDRWAVDVICGGPPCQPYSAAGEGKGQDDEPWTAPPTFPPRPVPMYPRRLTPFGCDFMPGVIHV